MTDTGGDTGGKVSFVIATRDRANGLQQTLRRLLETTPCPIIVVDNNSHDDTRDVVCSFSALARVKLVALSRNRGAVARNAGVAACRTPYVAFCDDDSWWEPDAPGIGAELFDRHPGVAVLAAQTLVWPPGRRDPFSDVLAASALGRRPGMPGVSVLGFQSCSAMVRASAFLAAGGFSPVLHFRGEEQLLALDLATAGWELCYCPELVAYHQPSPVRAAPAAQQARVARNDFLTCLMRRPPDRCAAALRRLLAGAAGDPAHVRAAAEALVRAPLALGLRRRLSEDLETKVRRLEAA